MGHSPSDSLAAVIRVRRHPFEDEWADPIDDEGSTSEGVDSWYFDRIEEKSSRCVTSSVNASSNVTG